MSATTAALVCALISSAVLLITGAVVVLLVVWLCLLLVTIGKKIWEIQRDPDMQLLKEARAIRGVAVNPTCDILKYIMSRR